jgi:hypothetical protein
MGLVSDWPQARQQKRSKEVLQFAAEEAEREMLPVKEKVAQQERLLREIAATERQIAAQELLQESNNKILQRRCKRIGELGDQTPEQAAAAVFEVHSAAKLDLEAKGFKIQQPDYDQFISKVLRLNTDLEPRDKNTFLKVVEYALECGAVTDREIVAPPEPIAKPVPAPEATAAELLDQQEVTTREGERTGRRLATEALVDEAIPLFRQFVQHMRNVWSHPMTKKDQDRCIQHCRDHNYAFNAAGFDRCRIEVLGCLLDSEKALAAAEHEYDDWRAANPRASEWQVKQIFHIIRQKYGLVG